MGRVQVTLLPLPTEKKLWESLHRVATGHGTYTRFESGLYIGISDVEYVTRTRNGWLELKVATTEHGYDSSTPLRLRHPISMAQVNWLSLHHAPRRGLWSGTLIGIPVRSPEDRRTWLAFLLVPAPLSVRLLPDFSAPVRDLIASGSRLFNSISNLVTYLEEVAE